ncbi:MAG TPA: BatA domain-containing protein, partial [Urbifossiella sp.]|nr:BatA domain-containing protein [Urbifossiella sp.]
MAAGAALVSAPIIIHLINRMRFRRIKWAAMEFLLKAQKRMKRKLIIEQLILLFLRCLLVFLVGVLLARFKWFTPLEGQESRATAHVVILDDSPSTADAFTIDGKPTTAFDQGKVQIGERIAPAAAQANTPQSMDILLLSDLRQPNGDPTAAKTRPTVPKPHLFERLNDSTIDTMKSYLRGVQVSTVRDSLVNGLRTAKEVLDQKPDSDMAKVIHIVSDLRAQDWRVDGDALRQLITEYTAAGIKVHLIDVAYPNRKGTDRQPRSSDNVSIVEFKPKTRVAAKGKQVDFELRVRNSGAAELKNVRFEFFKNGQIWREVAATFESLPPNDERSLVVSANTGFDRVGTKEKPLDRFNVVSAKLADPEAGGIVSDNVRHTVVEVQDRLSVLVIEGQQDKRDKQQGDGFYLKKL